MDHTENLNTNHHVKNLSIVRGPRLNTLQYPPLITRGLLHKFWVSSVTDLCLATQHNITQTFVLDRLNRCCRDRMVVGFTTNYVISACVIEKKTCYID
jgi:hypothetical protein